MDNVLRLADTMETEKRAREVQLLINVIEPDPEFQPCFVSDLASLYDVTAQLPEVIEEKIRFYFKGDLPAPINTPLWQFVDLVKQRYPGWPEVWPPEH
ncbi:hypothetical protein DU002_17370 [Corallincola holothuriorum]|uniref:Uncharacterized protein n=1 Tax=Corallincola holothuriorum TaxID=2282215 RepID=A0A368N4P3_9GAMM|nr:hypothetical protein [Corallincola holothuriorum]RCU45196.1 hypothetical protein DU002_17370 [Corallincola holothuriorum]